MLQPQTLRFLAQLNCNNNKTWFDEHRPQYEASRIDFSNFIGLVIDDLQKTDTIIAGITAKECLFRLNRDVRFSKDKRPYKNNFGASIKRGGKKSVFAGYYFHCEPGNSFVGGGLWMPGAPVLKNVRQEIDYNAEEFLALLKQDSFKKIFGDLYQGADVSLRTMPGGYDGNGATAKYLRLKSFIAEAKITDEELTHFNLHKKTVAAFTALQPLLQFLNRAIE